MLSTKKTKDWGCEKDIYYIDEKCQKSNGHHQVFIYQSKSLIFKFMKLR